MAQTAGGEVVLLDVAEGTYYSLNEVGGRVWSLCDGTRTVADMVAVICDEYDAPPDLVESDVVELLTGLAGDNLVVTA